MDWNGTGWEGNEATAAQAIFEGPLSQADRMLSQANSAENEVSNPGSHFHGPCHWAVFRSPQDVKHQYQQCQMAISKTKRNERGLLCHSKVKAIQGQHEAKLTSMMTLRSSTKQIYSAGHDICSA